MDIHTGYLHHIKDDFFNIVNDKGLMVNHENGNTRPTYLTIKDGDILWFIPLSSKVDKYKKIINDKINKYGKCYSILIEKIFDKEAAVLIQNAFPTIEKYVDHYHTRNKKPAKVSKKVKDSIINNFKETLKLKSLGINLFYSNIDLIKEQMLKELYN